MALLAQATPNSQVSNYRILERVASGGMGVVYKAFDLSLHRIVALKFLSRNVPDPAERERLIREARAASALDHENIAAIHRVGETDDGQFFIDMGFYDGENLATHLHRAPPTTAEALDIVWQAARGLAHAHAHNVIHRDIKPSNIILTHDGVVKIVDFGLAHLASPDASTASIDFAGTLAYMSPEQISGKSVDARTDIWSLGVMMYELLAGKQPFRGSSTASVLNTILFSEPEPVKELPPEWDAIVRRALEKDVEKRYQTCAELLTDLSRLKALGSAATSAAPIRGFWPYAKRHPVWNRLRHLFCWKTVRWVAIVSAVPLAAMLYPPTLNKIRETQGVTRIAPAPNEIYQQGLALLERYDKPDNLSGAIKKFEETTKLDPNFALAYAALGESYVDKYRQEQNPDWLKRAEQYCQTATRLNDQLPEVHVTLGRIHVLQGKHDLGLQEILHSISLDSGSVKAQLALGDAYAKLSRDQEAEQAYLKAIALRPNDWDAYQRHGFFYYSRQRNAEAAEQYRQAIRLAPDNARAHSNLAAALLNLGKTAEAENEMKQSVALGPTYTAYYNFAYFYYGQQRYTDAAKMATKAAELNSDDYRIWQMLGLCYEWTGQPEKARNAYAKELAALQNAEPLKVDDSNAQVELGLLYSKLQQRGNAELHLKTALALAPNDSTILTMSGEAYENLGEREVALGYIEKGILNGYSIEDLERNPDLRQLLADPKVQKRLTQATQTYAQNQTTNKNQ